MSPLQCLGLAIAIWVIVIAVDSIFMDDNDKW